MALEAMHRLAAVAGRDLNRSRLRRHAKALAIQAGIPEPEAALWGDAAVLHLVGRAGCGPAADPVAAAALGARLLGGTRDRTLRLAAAMAAGMAERWDGRGLPCGLAGEAVPLEARIAAVVLRFEELMRHPAEPSARPVAVSLSLTELAGTVLDPVLALQLRRMVAADAARPVAAATGRADAGSFWLPMGQAMAPTLAGMCGSGTFPP